MYHGGVSDISCPGCGESIDVNSSQCPVCLRERSAREITRMIRESKTSNKLTAFFTSRSLWNTIFGLATIGLAIFAHQKGWISKGRIRQLTNPEVPQTAAEPAPAGVPAPRNMEVVAAMALMPSANGAAAKNEEAAEKKPELWHIHGKVYDLVSLKPISGTRITFRDRYTDKKYRTRSNKRGRYTVKLPPLKDGGYIISVRHRRYGSKYIEEGRPAYHQMSLRRRKAELETLANLNVLHVPISLPEGENDLLHNLILSRP